MTERRSLRPRQAAQDANLVIAAAYLGITFAILRPLFATDQWRTNRLGTATTAIFFTCAVHHGAHAIHMLVPASDLPVALGARSDEGPASSLEATYKRKKDLFSLLTHEVGNQLTVIKGFAEMLLNGIETLPARAAAS